MAMMALPLGVVALLLGCLLGWYGRYHVIEPDHLHALCNVAVPAAGCAARSLLIDVTFRGTFGFAAVACGAVAWVLRGRPAGAMATLGLLVGGLGLFLFDTAWSASGVLCILLRLPRIGEEPASPREFSA
jgi:hypothetical protein